MREYEALFIFPSSQSEEAVGKVCERVENEIVKQGGAIVHKEFLGKRMFARRLKKQESGWYVLIEFDMEPDKLQVLQSRYRLIEDIFRVQIVRREKPLAVAEPARGPVEGAEDGKP